MYGKSAAVGSLAFTGLSLVWVGFAAFAVILALFAVSRMIPSKEA